MRETQESLHCQLERAVRRVLAGYFEEPLKTTEQVSFSRHEAIYHSAQSLLLRQEIVWNGRKLWDRHYVDGNGGNLSCRIAEDLVLCTPSMVSKADLRVDDLCLVDLDGKDLCGRFRRTSEILLHLEIYKANENARAVVHCHPPHATAYAIAGLIPPENVVPEQEVFVGPVAIAPYETPGTLAFARTVLPYVKEHNSILLANHGVVCWADTVTHAEWFVEVLDTYCRTLLLAYQLRAPIQKISDEKISDLLELKRRLGLPDARLNGGSDASKYEFPRTFAPDCIPEPKDGIGLLTREIVEAVTDCLNRRDGR